MTENPTPATSKSRAGIADRRLRVLQRIAIGLLGAWALAATIVALAGPDIDLQAGTVAEWMTAVLTLCAILIAIWGGYTAYAQFVHVQEETATKAAEELERQARAIFTAQENVRDLGDGRLVPLVFVDNRSEQPIRDVYAFVPGPDRCNPLPIGQVNASERRKVPQATEIIKQLTAKLSPRAEMADFFLINVLRFDVYLLFTDVHGQRWFKYPDNTLVQKPPTFDEYQAAGLIFEHSDALRTVKG
ncbi:hypothetical protein [Microlunatus sp. GCM10028923]|uniref:hypothetical protein n=1 Tax=Microlunatus sp. GCM10028923 TaxID=3273400 RepID=UPI00361CE21D